MKAQKEYLLCKQVATYLRLQYPKVLFHFDLTGLSLSKAQAGMNKAIQHGRGWPDLFIAATNKDGFYRGLFIELKAEGTRLWKKDGSHASPHIGEQLEVLKRLDDAGYAVGFAVGFDEAKRIIDNYLK